MTRFEWSAVLAMFAVSLSLPFVSAGDDLPFGETFESRSSGALGGQNGWIAAPSERVLVQTYMVYTGSQAVIVGTNAILSRTFADASATNVWVDFYARPRARSFTRTPTLNPDAVAGFYVDQNHRIVAYSNVSWVTLTNYTLPSDDWRRFSVHLDYGRSTWEIHVAGTIPNDVSHVVASNLSFSATATNTWFRRFSVKN